MPECDIFPEPKRRAVFRGAASHIVIPYFPGGTRGVAKTEGRNPLMRAYECVFILDPTLEEPAVKEKTDRFCEIITSRKGAVHNVDAWGKRRLAYPLNKRAEGVYTVLKFAGDNAILAELNRVFRFDDAVLRHLIVVDENPPQPAGSETNR
jgi:small subunit ribosomal protein S6